MKWDSYDVRSPLLIRYHMIISFKRKFSFRFRSFTKAPPLESDKSIKRFTKYAYYHKYNWYNYFTQCKSTINYIAFLISSLKNSFFFFFLIFKKTFWIETVFDLFISFIFDDEVRNEFSESWNLTNSHRSWINLTINHIQ